MRMRRGLLNWGIFLVCLGLVPLAVQLGLISMDVAAEIVRLWPLILIGIGIGLLLRFTRFDVLGVVVSASTSGLLIGSLLTGGIASTAAVGCGGGAVGGTPTDRHGSAGSALQFGVELTCGDMAVRRTSGSEWAVEVVAEGTPRIDAGATSIALRSASDMSFGPFGGRQREQWDVSLPVDSVLSVGVTVNAGASRMHLGEGALSDVSITYNAADGLLDLTGATSPSSISLSSTLNASSARIVLPTTSVNGSVTLNASSLELCAPPDLGLRITYDETLSSNNLNQAGLSQSQKSWTTSNFATASTRTDLHISANVSSMTLNPSGGCQ
jgi:hypothetical protein